MMGSYCISRVWRSFKKGIFSRNALFKCYGVIYIQRQRHAYLHRQFAPLYAEEANEMLSYYHRDGRLYK